MDGSLIGHTLARDIKHEIQISNAINGKMAQYIEEGYKQNEKVAEALQENKRVNEQLLAIMESIADKLNVSNS